MAKVGIGITTYNRQDCLNECLKNIARHTNLKDFYVDGDVEIYIARDTDEDRQGVAKRKNECLRALKDCDYVFLFDDDCFPIKDGWIEFFTRAGENHLLFLNDKLHNLKDVQSVDGVRYYNDCGGVFMYMTKRMINETIGAFDEKFELWGLEHCDWSVRYAGNKTFMMLEGTEEYLYAHDYSNINHKSSITNDEKNLLFSKNFPKFVKGFKDRYIPL